ncbi:hypothetical protein Daus18300_000226 [Diaporthe australafricana]|uniref:Aflatoxin regulatory protein domain-containing protein n=1 Tax=Diaporthe australafricana TaxID=127596 RepID=A0ABR3Y5S4_9PEZI
MCVYSPLGRLGRPRKPGPAASVDLIGAESGSLHTMDMLPRTTAASVPENHVESDDHQEDRDPEVGDTPMTDMGQEDEHADNGLLLNDPSPPRPRQASWAAAGGSQRTGTTLDSSPTSRNSSVGRNTRGTATSQTSWSAPNTSPQDGSSLATPNPQSPPGSGPDCYTAILIRTTMLEQSLPGTIATPGPVPPVNLVLEAERDLRALKHRLFTCTGHGHGYGHDLDLADDPRSSSRRTGPPRSCLSSNRPVLLHLSILAERVVSMLEDIFRASALSARAAEQQHSLQDWSWTGATQQQQHPAPLSARRVGRSFRSLLDRPCVFPIPRADSEGLRIGAFVVDGQVKARALKRILQLRVRVLLVVLEGMRRGVAPQLGSGFDQDRLDGCDPGPLEWEGSGSVMADAAGTLLEDLVRRIEALQGRMALVG